MPTKRDTNLPIQKKNYIKIKFSYNLILIFPYAEGIGLMEHLANAETLDTNDYGNPKIVEYAGDITMEVMGDKDYKNFKANAQLAPEEDAE